MAASGNRGITISPQAYEDEVEAVVREELTVLARSLSSRISWRLGTTLDEPDPAAAESQLDALVDGMIALMGSYGFSVAKDGE